jgi:lipopolysaccharide transport system permease protein
MRDFPATPTEMVASLWRHRHLIHAAVKREVLGRYRGSFLGLLWSFFHPLFMLAIYTFVFNEVFQARWSSGHTSRTEFALLLFCGLILFNLFSDCITRSPGLMLANPNYIKKVVFPLEILPFVNLLAAVYHAMVSTGVWLLAYMLFIGTPHLSALYLPLIIFPLGLLILGLSWVLASLGVFLRDVSQFTGIFTSVLIFISPVFYPVSSFPEKYRILLHFNPLTSAMEMMRGALYWGIAPEFKLLAWYWLVAAVVAWLGFFWFQKTRKGFADVL